MKPETEKIIKDLNLTRPIVFFDLETTSIDIKVARIIEFAAIKILPDTSKPPISVRILINPGKEIISKEITELTGITNDMVKDKGLFRDLANELYDFIKDCELGGYNCIKYDIPLLKEEFKRVNIDWDYSKCKVLDSCNIFKKKEGRTLSDASRFYLGKEHTGAHSALTDITRTIEVLFAQIQKYDDLPKDIDELHEYVRFLDPNAIDPDGKFIRNPAGDIVFGFGKHNGKKVNENLDTRDFVAWMLRENFSDETKDVARKILSGELK